MKNTKLERRKFLAAGAATLAARVSPLLRSSIGQDGHAQFVPQAKPDAARSDPDDGPLVTTNHAHTSSTHSTRRAADGVPKPQMASGA